MTRTSRRNPAAEGNAAGRAEATRNPDQGYPVANVANLDKALSEAAWICFASLDEAAVIYCTTDKAVADPESEERYLVFRSDDPMRHHVNPEQGWREIYTVAGKRS